jgi:hypothetical protein
MCKHWSVWGEWQKDKQAPENPNVPEDGPIRPKHVVKGNVRYIYATSYVDGNCNKTLR